MKFRISVQTLLRHCWIVLLWLALGAFCSFLVTFCARTLSSSSWIGTGLLLLLLMGFGFFFFLTLFVATPPVFSFQGFKLAPHTVLGELGASSRTLVFI